MPVDYDALAAKFGGSDAGASTAPAIPAAQPTVNYDALAAKFGGASSNAPTIPGNVVHTAPQPEPSLLDRIYSAANAGAGMIQNTVAAVPAAVAAAGRGLVNRIEGAPASDNSAQQTFDSVMGALGRKPADPLEAQYTRDAAYQLQSVPGLTGEAQLLGNAAKVSAPAVRAAAATDAADIGTAAKSLIPKISDPNTQALAEKFQDMGGQIPLHALSDNKYVRMAGEAVDNLPLSGSTKAANKVVVNQQLLKEIGGTPVGNEVLTPANFGPAMDAAGSAIGDIYGKTPVPLDDAFKSDLGSLFRAQSLQDATAVGDPVRNYIVRIANSAGDNGVIPGALLRSEDSALGTRIRGLPPGDLRNQLSDLQETMRDALARNLAPDDATALQGYRRQYAIGKQIEPLVAKSAFEGVSPQALMGRETATAAGKNRMAMGAAGSTGDLANVATRFVKEQPSSGTAERGIVMGTLGDLALAARAGAGVVVGNAYNRLGPKLSRLIVNNGRVAPAAARELSLAPAGGDIPTAASPFTPKAPQPSPIMQLGDAPTASAPTNAANVAAFQLRQEAISKLNDDLDRLSGIMKDTTKPMDVRVSAALKQTALRKQFADGIWGGSSVEDAKGLQNLYETRSGGPIARVQTLSDLAGQPGSAFWNRQ